LVSLNAFARFVSLSFWTARNKERKKKRKRKKRDKQIAKIFPQPSKNNYFLTSGLITKKSPVFPFSPSILGSFARFFFSRVRWRFVTRGFKKTR
jgi:hypothetical protein